MKKKNKKKTLKDERKSDGIIFSSNTKLLNSQDIYHNEIFECIHWYHTDKKLFSHLVYGYYFGNIFKISKICTLMELAPRNWEEKEKDR